MQSLLSIKYYYGDYYRKVSTIKCLNELSELEFFDLKKSRSDFFETLITKFADKTFCIQTDYDYEFGNVSWQRTYFNFSEAENAIFKDWSEREGQPGWTIDKSFVRIYTFSELKNTDEKEKLEIVEELQNLLKCYSCYLL